ncbi:metal-dependent hydrolase [Campylobacter lari]|uniref:Metallo-dependent hydrolase, subgroup D n=1 Tax=Campylobacter lari (strain RM2100 / D67 / ATCC BAA-1060) TaxID=306263 RepID=B9KEV7_CAMLR|nr:metal-dependent hydrolase [Campylobacter lari]ACM63592.1 metallo-dependent hydrolase, subgroup D [Campylobacter lari RM2100]EAH5177352.1 metal-dependent hydrolase [Campylobacter lari]EAH6292771.1 metal-dependent hydrolase [Campylobacter lari]EAH7837683.1 metal-dependent hydrolase [Campylobacter lari]EAI0924093.1 metal-dependent hydrolase [Campylobacter lari]
MFIIAPKIILTCDDDFNILENKAVLFDDNILEINSLEILQKSYPQAKLIQIPKDSLLLPAFINPHTHLEFSANNGNLVFGDFLKWLDSVFNNREQLSQKAKEKLILQNIHKMLKSGTATIGEISSFGSDLNPCVNSQARVIYFNEILGSNEAFLQEKQNEFLKRYETSLKFKNSKFIPAISVHAPYSTHPELAKFAIKLARENDHLLSTHFLESNHENNWLRFKKGGFKKSLAKFSKNPTPFYTPQSFLELFKDQRTLFTHCVYFKEWDLLDKNLHSITHCAFSNKLLSKSTLKLKQALKNGVNIHLGSDGLSSNVSLSMLDEMRTNLLIHNDFELENFAKILLLMATNKTAKALNLNLGEIKKGKIADFSVFKLPNSTSLKQLPLQFILQCKEVSKLFIEGKECNL